MSALCGPTWTGDDCELTQGHAGNHKRGDLVWTQTDPGAYRARLGNLNLRRPEALMLLSGYAIAQDFGEPDLIELAADSLHAFVQTLFGITSSEIEEAMKQ